MFGKIFGGRGASGQNVRHMKKGKKSPNRPTIYVRRNGSRYIDTNELINSDEFRETLEKLRGIDFKRTQRAEE